MKKGRKMKSVLVKDFFMEIKRSKARFLSILLIVFLGVAFFAGIRATSPDMKLSGDIYFDQQKLLDIRLVSTYGFTEEDVQVIQEIPTVEEVMPGYQVDVLCNQEDSKYVFRMMSLPDKMNLLTVLEGTLPQNSGECFLDEKLADNYGFQVGDTITVTAEQDTNLSDSLNRDTFQVVGIGTSPYYLSLDRGTTKVGNGALSGFVVIPEEDFSYEVYSEICVRVKGSSELLCYSDEYDDLIEETTDAIDAITDERCEIRYAKIQADGQEKIVENEQKIEDAKEKLDSAKEELLSAEKEIKDGERELLEKEEEFASGQAELEDGKRQLEDGRAQLIQAKETLDATKATLDASKAQLEDGNAQLLLGQEEFNAQVETFNQGMQQLQAGKDELEAKKQAVLEMFGFIPPAMEEQFAQAQAQLAYQEGVMIEGQTQLEQAKVLLEQKQVELNSGIEAYNSGVEQYEQGRRTYEEQVEKFYESEAQIADSERQLEDGRQKIEDAKNEIADAKAKLADGWQEYNEKAEDAQDEISEGEEKLNDAKEELAKLELPVWYVLTRQAIQNFVEYGQDSQRIEAIGKVFPAFFFLVAALICLTTMTRMVEESRVQIGTLKALGYSKARISAKYIFYAFFASGIGSAIGLVFGQKFLPWVIINAYKILYHSLPVVQTPLHLGYSISSAVLAIACSTLATVFACYKDLSSSPAALMRPMAPKAGKRILLERIGFIWKRLSFTQKSTFRNLFRYKRRFFMTIFGIGGCMALLLVGFGLKDSIMAIGELQFGKVRLYNSCIYLDDSITEEEKEKVEQKLEQDKRITDQLWVYETSMDVEKDGVVKSSYIVVPSNPKSLSDFVLTQDRVSQETYQLEDDGITITEKLAKLLDLKVGDTLILKPDDSTNVEAKISHIVENYFYHYTFLSPALYEKLFGKSAEFLEVYTKNISKEKSLEDEIQADYMDVSGVDEVSFMSVLEKRIDDMLKSMDSVIVILVISAGLLAFVVLYNLNNINVSERQRELATLKVLGFYDGEVSAYVLRENIWLTLIGSVVGIAFGIWLHHFVILTAETDILMFGRTMKWQSYVYSVLLTFAFSGVVNFVMHFRLKRINMAESMKSVE